MYFKSLPLIYCWKNLKAFAYCGNTSGLESFVYRPHNKYDSLNAILFSVLNKYIIYSNIQTIKKMFFFEV